MGHTVGERDLRILFNFSLTISKYHKGEKDDSIEKTFENYSRHERIQSL